jgi:hypothetical protein
MEKKEHELKMHVVKVNSTSQIMGIICAFLLGAGTLSIAAYLAFHGSAIPGTILGTGGIVALCSVFIYGSRRKT